MPEGNYYQICRKQQNVYCKFNRKYNIVNHRSFPAEIRIVLLFCRINKFFCRYDNFLFRLQNFLSDPQGGLKRPVPLIKFVNGTTCKIQCL